MDNPFKNFFSKADTNVIGVDIGSSAIKIVQLAKIKGRAVLKSYGSLALGPFAGLTIGQAANLPADKISQVIKDLIREANITSVNAGVAIPLRSSLVTMIEMPSSMSESQLSQMIPIEARKYIPVPITEVALDWWIIPKEEEKAYDYEVFGAQGPAVPDNKTDVLVVSIHNEVLGNFNSIVNAAGLQTGFFEIEMFAAIRALIDREQTSVMIMDVGAAVTKLYIVERGIIKKSHVINKGSQDVTLSIAQGLQLPPEKAEKIKRNLASIGEEDKKAIYSIVELTLDYIFSEASTVMLAYQKKHNKDIGKIILTGGGVAMDGFVTAARARFNTEVVIGDPFAKVDTPAFLSEMLRKTGLDFGVAVGLALRKLQEFG
ncbi:MAG TPA: type IV pilus assembly protein PilM [Candidatus Paceibacterota bacterium]|nr:type IV pilus assembly protein PilM [Candidatus Paceibacterota bacterium]